MLIMHDQSVCVFTLIEFQAFVFIPISWLGGVHKLRLQILPIFDHLPTSVYIG